MVSFSKAGVALAILFAAAISPSLAADDESAFVLTNAASRTGVDLSGEWGYSIDPYRDGLYGFHGSPAGRGHQRFDPADVDAATRKDTAALYEYDMRRASRVLLPESWDRHRPEMRHYEGLVWYERGFDVTLKRGERAFVHIGASNYATRIYVNGALAGEHEGGFTPIILEVTSLLRKGEDRIALGVDSIRDEASVPPPVTDWETYGGVTRPIKIVVTPATFIDDAWVRLTRNGFVAANMKFCKNYAVDGVSDLGFSIANANKDLGYFVKMLDDLETRSQIAEGTSANLQAAFDAGMGQGNVPEIFDYFRKLEK